MSYMANNDLTLKAYLQQQFAIIEAVQEKREWCWFSISGRDNSFIVTGGAVVQDSVFFETKPVR